MLWSVIDNSITVTVIFIIIIPRVYKVRGVYNKVRVRDNSDKELWTIIRNNKSIRVIRVSKVKTGWGDEL